MHTPQFGPYLKALRFKMDLSLREFCIANDFDAGNYSRLERGLLPPPQQEEKIQAYATALGVKPGSAEYKKLLDFAAIDNGKIPADLLNDAELMAELPALCRTVRGEALPDDKVERLIELLRKRG